MCDGVETVKMVLGSRSWQMTYYKQSALCTFEISLVRCSWRTTKGTAFSQAKQQAMSPTPVRT